MSVADDASLKIKYMLNYDNSHFWNEVKLLAMNNYGNWKREDKTTTKWRAKENVINAISDIFLQSQICANSEVVKINEIIDKMVSEYYD